MDDKLPLCRLQYFGSDTDWGFAFYQASTETYADALLPNGHPTGTPEQALDCAYTSPTPAPGSTPRWNNAALH